MKPPAENVGKQGIPVYNAIVLMKIIGRPGGRCYFYSNYKPNYVSSNLIETLRSFGKNLA
jgi:hypothetical protein